MRRSAGTMGGERPGRRWWPWLGIAGAGGLIGSLLGLAPMAAPAAAGPRPAYVAVSGNRLVNAAGSTIRLLGVDRSGTEFECLNGRHIFDGPASGASITAMLSWHIDAVRLPLNEDCWLGIDGVPAATGGAAYRDAIERYVAALHARGVVVILDLHWSAPGPYLARTQWPMADASHAPAFWTSVASTFKNDHGLIFDLYNEPYITSWSCWLRGCSVPYHLGGTEVTYQSAGMQTLVDAVRATGATQPLMVGGLAWASDESQWLSHEPVDPDHQLLASFHTYNFSGCSTRTCWNDTIAPLARAVPVVTGEMGERGCTDGYINEYMAWADAHGISYLGWAWDSTGPPSYWSCSGGPALITGYGGSPTPYGVGLEGHLRALAAARLAGPTRAG